MKDLCYIAIANLHKSKEPFIIGVYSDEKEAFEAKDAFNSVGYKTRVVASMIQLSEDAVRRIWRTRQKRLETEQMQ